MLPPGSHTVNVQRFTLHNEGFEPESEVIISFTAEAGKIYVVSTSHYYDHAPAGSIVYDLEITSSPKFWLRELGKIPDDEQYPERGFSGDRETFIMRVEEAVAKLSNNT
jgi:hypothetical protein